MIEVPAPYYRLPSAISSRPDLRAEAKIAWAFIAFSQVAPDEAPDVELWKIVEATGVPARTLQRALAQLADKGLLKVTPRRGKASTYRVLLPAERACGEGNPRQNGVGTHARLAGVPRHSGVGTHARLARVPRHSGVGTSLQSTVKETNEHREDDRLLSLAFGRGWTDRQKAALLNTVDKARAAGVPVPFMAHALVSRKATGEPWKRIDQAVNKAKEIVQWLNLALEPKHLEDLQHLIDFGAAGNETPKTIRVDGERLVVAQIVNQCTTWPAPCEKSA